MKTVHTKIATTQLLFGELSKSLDNDSFKQFNVKLDALHKELNSILLDRSIDKKERIRLVSSKYKDSIFRLYDDLKDNLMVEHDKLSLIELDILKQIDEEHEDVG